MFRKSEDIEKTVRNNPNGNIFFDNRCILKRGNIDFKKVMHRLSRIVDKSFAYHATKFNCDEIATWVLTGRVNGRQHCWILTPLYLKKDGQIDVLEIKKEEDVFMFRKSEDIEEKLKSNSDGKIFFDNRCILKRGNIDFKKVLHRLKRIIDKSFAYNVTRLNCDETRYMGISIFLFR